MLLIYYMYMPPLHAPSKLLCAVHMCTTGFIDYIIKLAGREKHYGSHQGVKLRASGVLII